MPDSKKSEKFKMERIAVYDKLMGIFIPVKYDAGINCN
jgi:hypothetical protein